MIYEKIWKGSQSLNYETVFREGEHVLKISVKHDAYVAQSYARISRHDGAHWHELVSIPGEAIRSVTSYAKRGQPCKSDFGSEPALLLERARQILGIKPPMPEIEIDGVRVEVSKTAQGLEIALYREPGSETPVQLWVDADGWGLASSRWMVDYDGRVAESLEEK